MSPSHAVLPQLLTLICDLYENTRGLPGRADGAQLWYDRGYANGMIDALRSLGYEAQVESMVEPDPPDAVAAQALLPWGKAYTHGFDMGRRETHDVMG